MQRLALTGPDVELLTKRIKDVYDIRATRRKGIWVLKYNEHRSIYVIAFGHVHFKRCCLEHGLDWHRCHHLNDPGRLKSLKSDDALVLIGVTQDPCKLTMMAESKGLLT